VDKSAAHTVKENWIINKTAG